MTEPKEAADEQPRRRYDSPVRRAGAAATRAKVIESAAAVFAAHGYEGATIAKIAERAGVSPDTVTTVGSKAFLLLEGFRVRAMGEGGPETLLERDWATEIFAITDPDEGMTAVVARIAQAHIGAADLWTLINATAPTDPMVADVLDELKKSRDATFDVTLDWLVQLGAIPASAIDDPVRFRIEGRLALSAEQYLQLTRDWGYDDDGYRDWLARRLADL